MSPDITAVVHPYSRQFSCVCYVCSGYDDSKLYGNAPTDVLSILVSENVTANFHHFCVTTAVSDVTFPKTDCGLS